MSVRLSELAKALGTSKKELLEKLPALGFELKKSVVDIEESLADQIRSALQKSGVTFAPPPKKPAARAAAAKKKVVKKKVAKKAAKKKVAKKAAEERTAKSPAATPDSGAASPTPARPQVPAVTPRPASPPPATPAAVARPSATPAPPAAAPVEAPTPRAAAPRTDVRAGVAAKPATPAATQPVPPSSRVQDTVRVIRRAGPPAMSPGGPIPGPSGMRPPGGKPGPGMGRPPAPGGGGGRPVPEHPRTTPKAARPMYNRPMGKRGGRSSRRQRQERARPSAPPPSMMPSTPSGPLKPIKLSESVTVKELGEKLNIRSRDVIKSLLGRGVFATINQTLEREIAIELCKQFGFEASIVSFEEESILDEVITESEADLAPRPPVVTVMGHVDHGKTSLLDAIRESNVADREAGKITQHIGAYQVEKRDRKITFLDTPGHEAFTLMRSRGAKVTDIVVLVVAADDGVMPQTIEAIHHAKAAEVPIIVAINKMDLPTANPDRVLQMLADHGLLAEEWGGETVTVKLSAKKKENLDALLEMVLLVADIGDYKANPNRTAAGVVLEAKLDKGRGAVATCLIQHGTLRPGESFIAGSVYGKVRAMVDDHGARLESAGPSTPVEVIGLQGVPNAGDPIQVVTEDAKARQIGSFRQMKLREQELANRKRVTLGDLYQQISEGDVKELPIIIKGDVQGSVEALSDMLQKLSTDKVKIRIIHSAAGAITETDVLFASASNAIIIGFNVRPERKARELADQEKVEFRLHTVIYNVTDEIKAAMEGMLDPTFEEVVLGRIEIRQLFRVPKIGVIAGCYVTEGRVTRDSQIRLLRDNVIVYEGKLGSLKRFKEDVSEVRQGYECGLSVANYQNIKENDVVEAFKMEKVERKKS